MLGHRGAPLVTGSDERGERGGPQETTVRSASSVRYFGTGRAFRLEAPRLRTFADPSENRHATWFELFFDLVFAAALSELGESLARDPSARTFARFAGLFIVVVWAWIVYTLYANRFDTDDLGFRLAASTAMLAVLAGAVNLTHVLEGRGGAVGFAVAYVVLRSLLVALYVRARNNVVGPGRRLSQIYIAGYSFTTGLWLLSIFLPSPWRFLVWGLAMLVDLAVPTRAWAVLGGHSVVVSHLTERFGTFFLLVLGESVVAAVVGVAGLELTWESWIVAGLCFTIGLVLWWIYFDLADTSVVGRGVLGLIFVYGHLALLVGVAAFGAGTELVVTEAAQPGLSAGARWALAGGIGAFALSLASLHIGAERTSIRDGTFVGRLALAAFALALAAVGGAIAPLGFVGLVSIAVLGQLLLEAVTTEGRGLAQ